MKSLEGAMFFSTPVEYLFTDLDGVLHPDHCHASKHFMHRGRFEEVIRAFPSIALVISSTWRLPRTLDGMRDFFSPDIRERLVGLNPEYRLLEDVPEKLVGYEREAECRAWLTENGHAAKEWLAVDDRSWNFRPFNPNVFLVDPRIGLDQNAAEALFIRLRDGRSAPEAKTYG